MKKLILAGAVSVMLLPAVASAELSYNSVGLSYQKTTQSGYNDQNAYDLSASYGVTSNVFVRGDYLNGSVQSSDVTFNRLTVGAGYHMPVSAQADFIVAADLDQVNFKAGGVSDSAHGYDLSVGLRDELSAAFEVAAYGVYRSETSNWDTTTGTALQLEAGYKVTPAAQLFVGIESASNKPSASATYNTQTVSIGARYYY